MTAPKPDLCRCMRCKVATPAAIYMSAEIDPFSAMPLCLRCALLACFRVGKAGKT